MSESTLMSFSDQLADAAAAMAPSVVQVHGRRRPSSGTVYAPGVVITTARALNHEDSARVRTTDGRVLEAEVAGWDPATHLAVLRVEGLDAPPAALAPSPARVGHLALAIGRSWSNALTASMGIVAVIGGPLPTGRGYAIAEVIRTTAPMHDGFAGGALAGSTGQLVGIATAAAIRGLGVVIPATIAWSAAKEILEHGQRRRGYLGLSGQSVPLGERQHVVSGRDRALLVVGTSPGGPAETAGLLVGDVLIEFEGRAIESPEALLDALAGKASGSAASLRVLRGDLLQNLTVTVGVRE
jgi:serine protease Do